MNDASPQGAVVSSRQIIELSHPLAAANHYQWVTWEQWVLRYPEDLTPDGADRIIEKAQAEGLDEELKTNSKTVVDIVSQGVGSFAYLPELSSVTERKLSQFTSWVKYAVGKSADDRKRWLLQCRTPFVGLSPQMQRSDYTEAAQDLAVIAEAGGLVLADPLPELKPLSEVQLNLLRLKHCAGLHGPYVISEQPWTNVCVGCHDSWAVSR